MIKFFRELSKQLFEQLTYLGTVVPPTHDALWGAAQMAWELL